MNAPSSPLAWLARLRNPLRADIQAPSRPSHTATVTWSTKKLAASKSPVHLHKQNTLISTIHSAELIFRCSRAGLPETDRLRLSVLYAKLLK